MAKKHWTEREYMEDCGVCGQSFAAAWHCSEHPRYHGYQHDEYEPPQRLREAVDHVIAYRGQLLRDLADL